MTKAEDGAEKKRVEEILAGIKHPSINLSLIDLGIIKNFDVQEDKAKVVFAFPFLNIPIKEQIIESVKIPLERVGLKVEVEITVMSQEELEKFLSLEQANWKGL